MSAPEDDARSALPPDQHADGELIAGRYQIKELIGKGSTGAVYRAEDPVMSRCVAIKFLTLPIEQSDLAVKRFRQEAKLSSKLDHPNICRTLALGEEGQSAYIVAEWLEGKTLAQVIKEERVLMAPRVISLATQLCDGLSAAHNEGIVHRDIKPGNIIITTDPDGKEVAKIIDFGTSLILQTDEKNSQKLTSTGSMLGTPAYMSPEQCIGRQADERSDIYSLGCTIYEMVSGQLPFHGSSSYEVLSAHVNKTPPPVNQIASTSEELARIITNAMMKEPEKRYQCAKELKSALSSVDTRQLQVTRNRPQTRKFHSWLWAALTLVLLAGGAFPTFRFFQQQQAETEQSKLASNTEAQARRWMAKGNYSAAALSWNNLARMQPKNVNHLIMLAHCYNQEKQYEPALVAARAAIELDPQNTSVYWEKGLAEYRVGECLAGINHMKAYIDKPPPGQEDRRFLFAQTITSVFPAKAIKLIDRLLLEHEKSGSMSKTVTSEAELRYFRGLAAAQQYQFKEAKKDLLFVQGTNPDRPSLNANLALVEAQLGEADKAQMHLHADGSNTDATLPNPTVMQMVELLIAKHQDKNYRDYHGDALTKAEMEFRDSVTQCDKEVKAGNTEAARVSALMAVNTAHLLSTALWKEPRTIDDLARMIWVANRQNKNLGTQCSNIFNYSLLAEQRLGVESSREHQLEAIDKLRIVKEACCKAAANQFCQEAEELAKENRVADAVARLEIFHDLRSKQNPFSFLALLKANELRASHGIHNRKREAANCYGIGNGYLMLGDYKLAEENFAKAVTIGRKRDPNNLFLYLQSYGAMLYKLKQYELSKRQLEEALTIIPKQAPNPNWAAMGEASTHVMLATTYRALKDNAAGDKEDLLAENIVKNRFGIGSQEYKDFLASRSDYLNNLNGVGPLDLHSSLVSRPSLPVVPEVPRKAN